MHSECCPFYYRPRKIIRYQVTDVLPFLIMHIFREKQNIRQVKQSIGTEKILLNKCNSVKLHYTITEQY